MTWIEYRGLSRKIRINDESCDGCGTCVGVCPATVLEIVEKSGRKVAVAARPQHCQGFRSCEVLCAPAAIKVIE